MAFESTAINELVAGIQQRPLERDSSDWLFGEGDEATEIDPRGAEVGLFEPDPRVVSLPRPYAEMPAYAVEHAYQRQRSATTHVHAIDWAGIAKKLALPIAVVSIISVALAVYFAKADEAPAKASPVVASENAGASVEDVKLEVTAEAVAVPAEPTTDAEPAEAVAVPAEPTTVAEPAKPVAVVPAAADAGNDIVAAEAAVAPVPVAKATPPAAKATAPAAKATPPVAKATPPVAAPAAAEAVKVEPGSPASRFLAPPPVETTIRTAAKPAPAPTAVPGLLPPAPAATRAPAAKPAAAPVAKVAATPVAKKSARQLRAEKRAAAKRAKRVAKVRAKSRTKRVAVAADDAGEARPSGKGILSIASTPSMQVWVDGRNSKAMTPVRIKLLAGKHKVTLLDNGRGKSRSFSVVIKPDETLKITKNYE